MSRIMLGICVPIRDKHEKIKVLRFVHYGISSIRLTCYSASEKDPESKNKTRKVSAKTIKKINNGRLKKVDQHEEHNS